MIKLCVLTCMKLTHPCYYSLFSRVGLIERGSIKVLVHKGVYWRGGAIKRAYGILSVLLKHCATVMATCMATSCILSCALVILKSPVINMAER